MKYYYSKISKKICITQEQVSWSVNEKLFYSLKNISSFLISIQHKEKQKKKTPKNKEFKKKKLLGDGMLSR